MERRIGLLLAAVFVAIGCSSSSSPQSPTQVCTPGTTQSCACPGVVGTGVQTCNEQGSGFGSCSGCSSGDSGPGCTTENGATACDRDLSAWCDRYVQCCNSGSTCDSRCQNLVPGTSTSYNACNTDACKAYLTRLGYDCAASTYTSKNVCTSVTQKCIDDWPLLACSDMLGGTANEPVSCKTFDAQF